jgi:hypothetical protein
LYSDEPSFRRCDVKTTNSRVTITVLLALLATVAGATQNKPRATAAALKPLPPDYAYPGEVRAFAGETCPINWLVADGKEYPTSAHKRLEAAIGDLWGSSTTSTFQVPDLRGMFLRGWQQVRAGSGDPEAASRDIPPGAPIDPTGKGNHVGTYQGDTFTHHNHATTLTGRWGDHHGDTAGWGIDDGQWGNYSIPTDSAGGAETRPRNVYLLFCIRDAN